MISLRRRSLLFIEEEEENPYKSEYFTIVAESDGTFLRDALGATGGYAGSSSMSGPDLYWSINGGVWNHSTNRIRLTISAGDRIRFKCETCNVAWAKNGSGQSIQILNSGMGVFRIVSAFRVEGNILSLSYLDDFKNKTKPQYDNNYMGLFDGSLGLTNAENLVMPKELTTNCFYWFFRGDNKLTKAPLLPAQTLTQACYYKMFSGCSNLGNITCLATDISAPSCTEGWLENVKSSGTFTKASGMNNWTSGVNGIPSGWTVVNA